MWKITCIAFIAALLCACKSQEKTFSDEDKIAAFQKLCKESAYESFAEKSADGSVLLEGAGQAFGLSGWSLSKVPDKNQNDPVGAAHLQVLDLEYSPAYLLGNLFDGNNAVHEVIYTREGVGTNYQIPAECRVAHMLSVKSKEEAEAAFLHVCDVNRIVKSLDGVRYYIGQAYGDPDENEIIKFVFYIKDRVSGRIIAEQRSYQLLMGAMSEDENRVILAMGGAQGARNCPLTPPDQVVKRVFY
ncbi:hypothetical protein [Ralstonia solanacearum]|uniref:Lipoprotein n=1 Tax=Ralstonia solanacearum CFBP2957 TaxID=859656 RepID=D8P636_RALSL|nr:hypothetical protein [Ralstonia solanacearum]CBJ54372.1 exported protein of unknown function [Ralstonia solanacearum CFBP2957]